MKDDKVETPAAEGAEKVESPIEGNEGKSPSDAAAVNAEAKKEVEAANKAKEQKPAFNLEASHKELLDRHGRLDKSYKELQKHATQSSMKAAELEKKLDQVLTHLAKSAEVEIDPQAFVRDVNERGHLPIMELIKKEVDSVRTALEKKSGELSESQELKIAQLEAELYIERMKADSKNFPGFADLQEQFGEILDDPNCPIRQDLSVLDQLKALYNIAKTRSAEQAVALAKEEGKKETEKQLAKEAAAHTAGGGKTPGTTEPDWDNMPLDKHRKLLVDMYGIRE